MFKDIKGQSQAIKILQKGISTGSIAGAYLFTGPTGVGKTLTALTFAKTLNCKEEGIDSCDKCSSCKKIDHQNHPDVRIIIPEKETIKIEQIRRLKSEIFYRLYEGRKKVWIIEKADKLTMEAANSLLKILEEPPPQALIILISQTKEELLPTILSRCEIIRFFPLPMKEIEEIIAVKLSQDPHRIHLLARLARGRAGEALHLIEEESLLKTRDEVLDSLGRDIRIENIFKLTARWANCSQKELERILDIVLFWFRDLLILKQGDSNRLINYDKIEQLERKKEKYSLGEVKQIAEIIEKSRYHLKSNVNPKLVLENLWLKLSDTALKTQNIV